MSGDDRDCTDAPGCERAAGPICPYCKKTSELVTGADVYPHREDLHLRPFWMCKPCRAWVGCHPKSTRPLGTPANAQLRGARRMVHELLDPLWKASGFRRGRLYCYRFLADKLGKDFKDTHTGMFTLEDCQRARSILMRVSFDDVLVHRQQELARRGNLGGFE